MVRPRKKKTQARNTNKSGPGSLRENWPDLEQGRFISYRRHLANKAQAVGKGCKMQILIGQRTESKVRRFRSAAELEPQIEKSTANAHEWTRIQTNDCLLFAFIGVHSWLIPVLKTDNPKTTIRQWLKRIFFLRIDLVRQKNWRAARRVNLPANPPRF